MDQPTSKEPQIVQNPESCASAVFGTAAVDCWKRLELDKPTVLNSAWDQVTRQAQSLTTNTSELLLASSERSLARGTPLVDGDGQIKSFVGAGTNLDLGGNALYEAQQSKFDLTKVRQSDFNADQTSAMQQMIARVDADEAAILGPHDIPRVIHEIAKSDPSAVSRLTGQIEDAVTRNEAYAKPDNPLMQQFVAKEYRDLAVLYAAKVEQSGPSAAMHDSNVKYMKMLDHSLTRASEFAPKNPDSIALLSIADDQRRILKLPKE